MGEDVEKCKADAVTKGLQIGDSFRCPFLPLGKPHVPLETVGAPAVLAGAAELQPAQGGVAVQKVCRCAQDSI